MRRFAIGLAVWVVLAAGPAAAEVTIPHATRAIPPAPAEASGNPAVPSVERGGLMSIECGALPMGDDIRVILALGERQKQVGYARVLATRQRVENGTLLVRVPNTPGLAHQTVDVKVYVVDGDKTNTCDAGRYKVT